MEIKEFLYPLKERTKQYWKDSSNKILYNKDITFVCFEGPIRSGKNTLATFFAAKLLISPHIDNQHMAQGVTTEQAISGIWDVDGFGIKYWFDLWGIKYGKSRGDELDQDPKKGIFLRYYTPVKTDTGYLQIERKLYFKSCRHKNSYKSYQGMSFGIVLRNEPQLFHPANYDKTQTRIVASNYPKIIDMINPEDPNHLYYRHHDPMQKAGKLVYLNNKISDNPFFQHNPDKLENILKIYPDKTTIAYKRDILGIRASSGLRIHGDFSTNKHMVDNQWISRQVFTEISFSMDVGDTDDEVVMMKGLTDTGHWVGIHGLKFIEEDEIPPGVKNEHIYNWITDMVQLYPKWANMIRNDALLLIDKAAKGRRKDIETLFYEKGLTGLTIDKDSGHTIQDRINLRNTLLGQYLPDIDGSLMPRYLLNRDDKIQLELAEAIMASAYDPDKYEKGIKERPKDYKAFNGNLLDADEYATNEYVLGEIRDWNGKV